MATVSTEPSPVPIHRVGISCVGSGENKSDLSGRVLVRENVNYRFSWYKSPQILSIGQPLMKCYQGSTSKTIGNGRKSCPICLLGPLLDRDVEKMLLEMVIKWTCASRWSGPKKDLAIAEDPYLTTSIQLIFFIKLKADSRAILLEFSTLVICTDIQYRNNGAKKENSSSDLK